ncbi:29977_t:CDS:2, partial [Racocetra persica]
MNLEQKDKEKTNLIAKLEQNDKDTASENAELKARVAKLEQKQSQTNEKNNFIVKSDDDAKGIDQSSVIPEVSVSSTSIFRNTELGKSEISARGLCQNTHRKKDAENIVQMIADGIKDDAQSSDKATPCDVISIE